MVIISGFGTLAKAFTHIKEMLLENNFDQAEIKSSYPSYPSTQVKLSSI